jgi:predicted amidohydrolase
MTANKRTETMRNAFLAVLLLIGATVQTLCAETIKIGVAQTVIENHLSRNRDKLLDLMARAKAEGCHLVIFPENALYWAGIAAHRPSQAELDAAIEQIRLKARSEQMYVVFGGTRKLAQKDAYHNTAVAYGPRGRRLMFYNKNMEVPQRFYVRGVPVSVAICSDRGYLEHSDLPCLVQGAQIIIDISGGHGGDDGRPELRRIRYRPWAQRTGAYVIVANPVHDDTDFMGHSPWGGGSAIIRPDGSIMAGRMYEKDELIVEEIDTARATRAEAKRRRSHPVFKSFWDMGKEVLEGGRIDSVQDITPLSSAARDSTDCMLARDERERRENQERHPMGHSAGSGYRCLPGAGGDRGRPRGHCGCKPIRAGERAERDLQASRPEEHLRDRGYALFRRRSQEKLRVRHR